MSHPDSWCPRRARGSARPGSICCALWSAAALGAAPAAWAGGPEWYVQVGGISHHFQPTKAAGRQWQEQHPGLGLERRTTLDNGWSLRSAAGAMQDSRGFWSGYAGAAYLRTWRWPGVAEAGAGLGAYAFYRSTSWSGRMSLVPGVLPTASITFPESNLGLTFVYVPPIGGYNKSMPSVLLAQMSLRFR